MTTLWSLRLVSVRIHIPQGRVVHVQPLLPPAGLPVQIPANTVTDRGGTNIIYI
jgi:hypothetical protein